MTLRPRLVLLILSLLIGPPAAAAAEPAADFSAYRTYGWVERKASADRPVVLDAVKAAIAKRLAVLGYAPAPHPDLTIVFSVGARDRLETGPDVQVVPTRHGPMILGADDSQRVQTEGTLTIQMFDVRTRRPVFRAVATEPLSPRGADAKVIDRAVAQALAQLPARP